MFLGTDVVDSLTMKVTSLLMLLTVLSVAELGTKQRSTTNRGEGGWGFVKLD